MLGWALMEARAALAKPSANEEARQAALAQEDQRLQAHVRDSCSRGRLLDLVVLPRLALHARGTPHPHGAPITDGCCDQARSQVHIEKAPPKHSLAAMAAVASRRERQQDSVMGQMQSRAAEVSKPLLHRVHDSSIPRLSLGVLRWPLPAPARRRTTRRSTRAICTVWTR